MGVLPLYKPYLLSRPLSPVDSTFQYLVELDKDIILYKDAQAEIGTLGLMGDKYLNVYPGGPQAGVLEEPRDNKKGKTHIKGV